MPIETATKGTSTHEAHVAVTDKSVNVVAPAAFKRMRQEDAPSGGRKLCLGATVGGLLCRLRRQDLGSIWKIVIWRRPQALERPRPHAPEEAPLHCRCSPGGNLRTCNANLARGAGAIPMLQS